MKAAGSSTNALASASGLSRTMAISILPPSFWMRAGRPACICSRIATALFSHRVRSHSSRLFVQRCQFVVDHFGLLASLTRECRTVRQRGGRQVCETGYCTANVTIFYIRRRDDLRPMATRSQPTVAAVCILSSVPCIFGSTLRCETIGYSVIYFY